MVPEITHMVPKAQSPSKPVYYFMHMDYRARPAGYEVENAARLQEDGQGLEAYPPWPDGYGHLPNHPWRFPTYIETPRLRLDKKLGRPMRDLEGIGAFWFVSAGMKAVLEKIDPAACEFRKCETVLSSGDPGPETWLCSITRILLGADVIDCDATEGLTLRKKPNGFLDYGVYPIMKLRFKRRAIGSAHLFRILEMGDPVFCDQDLKSACKDSGLKGIAFQKMES
jgi:hypothetical protein